MPSLPTGRVAVALAITCPLGLGCLTLDPSSSEATDDSYTLDEDSRLSVDAARGVLANDDLPHELLGLVVDTPPEHGTLTLAIDGSFVYRPDRDYAGTDRFTYLVEQAGTEQPGAAVQLTIEPVNDAPFVGNTFAIAAIGNNVEVNVLDQAIDVEGDALTLVGAEQPDRGTVAFDANGRLTFFPDDGAGGVTVVDVSVSDGAATGPATVTFFMTDGFAAEPSILRLPTPTGEQASLSGDGRLVAFQSPMDGLVAGDDNGAGDVFVYDRMSDEITLVAKPPQESPGDLESREPALSMDGRFVAFTSDAANLFDGDDNGAADIFIRDLATGELEVVSVATNGSLANGQSRHPTISADGRFVAFVSDATNLAGSPPAEPAVFRLYLRDRDAGTTTLLTAAADGGSIDEDVARPAISADGRFVAYLTQATNIEDPPRDAATAHILVHDRATGETVRGSGDFGAVDDQRPSMTPDGRWITAGSEVIETFDLLLGERHMVTVAADGTTASSGRSPSAAAGGRFTVFASDAANLAAGDSNNTFDVFVRDAEASTTSRVSLSRADVQGDGPSVRPTISADGRWIVFESDATNLTSFDNNEVQDLFVVKNPAL